MTKQDIELAKKIVRHTTAWRLKQILYKAGSSDLRIWTGSTVDDCFHNTEIIPLFVSLFSTYITYDQDIKKCVLVIF